MEQFLVVGFTWGVILVKYTCKGKKVSEDEIEDAIYSHLENAEDDSDEEMVNEVLKSFPGVEFEILPCSHIVVD